MLPVDPMATVSGSLSGGALNGGGGYSYSGPSSEAATKGGTFIDMKTLVFGGANSPMPSVPMSSALKYAALAAVVVAVWLWKR